MISYVIATYSNVIQSRIGCYKNPELVLQLQLEQLYLIFNKKKNDNIPNLIEKIIVVCPEPKEKRNLSYYDYEKWTNKFKDFNISVDYIDYIGENKHHSYDQWIQGYLYYPNSEYYIIIEDDYCIDVNNITFDIDLVRIYKENFNDNIGYLGSVANYYNNSSIWHMGMSNGMISKDTFKKLGENILSNFYSIEAEFPQLMFSIMFTRENILLKDVQEHYTLPFWESWIKKYFYYGKNTTKKRHLFIPIQFVE